MPTDGGEADDISLTTASKLGVDLIDRGCIVGRHQPSILGHHQREAREEPTVVVLVRWCCSEEFLWCEVSPLAANNTRKAWWSLPLTLRTRLLRSRCSSGERSGELLVSE